MRSQPISLLVPYHDQLSVGIIRREDSQDWPGQKFSEQRAASLFGVQKTASLHQVHGGRTIVVDSATYRTEQADGLITSHPDLLVVSRWADCQNFVVYAPDTHVVGVLHVGWRGLLAEAIANFVHLFAAEYGIGPEELLVGAGPSLCQTCAEFSDPPKELPGVDPSFFQERLVDLRGIADAQWQAAGVSMQNFERMDICTRCQNSEYWSYRGGDRETVQGGCLNALCAVLR